MGPSSLNDYKFHAVRGKEVHITLVRQEHITTA